MRLDNLDEIVDPLVLLRGQAYHQEGRVTALEQAGAKNKMTALLKRRLGNNQISDPVPTPLEGLFETQFGANFGYLSKDGRYIIVGNLIDLQSGQNLTNIAKGKVAIAAINKFTNIELFSERTSSI